ncbi:hypothetical protein F4775DRAFT_102970 [Biscogniauxia sp. FL1348]|nr:hypothetical protein F4775DRAFT_102970 [Biscogniauxia sp. FL1348]
MASYNDYTNSNSSSSSGNGSGTWNHYHNNYNQYGNYIEDMTPKYPDVQNNQEWLEVVPNQSPLYPVPIYEPLYATQGAVHTPRGIQTSGALETPATAEAAERGEGKSPGGDSSWESDPPSTGQEAKNAADSRRRILGLTVPVFWALVIAAVIILAAGIGGGIGGGLVAQQQKSNSNSSLGDSNPTPTTPSGGGAPSSSSSSSSSSSAATSATVALPSDGGCPQIEGQTYTPYAVNGQPIPLEDGQGGQTFRQQCYTNWVSSAASGTHDILRIYMPTLENCIMTCAEYNAAYRAGLAGGAGVGGGYCVAVSIVKQSAGFCYLKNGTATNDTTGTPEAYSSAVLITDTST